MSKTDPVDRPLPSPHPLLALPQQQIVDVQSVLRAIVNLIEVPLQEVGLL